MEDAPSVGVKIFVNGVEKTKTDANGKYLIEFEKPETLLIETKSERNIYDSIKIKVDSTTRNLPTLKAIAVYLCGYVGLQDDKKSNNWHIKDYKPSVGRKVYSQQQPNPIEG